MPTIARNPSSHQPPNSRHDPHDQDPNRFKGPDNRKLKDPQDPDDKLSFRQGSPNLVAGIHQSPNIPRSPNAPDEPEPNKTPGSKRPITDYQAARTIGAFIQNNKNDLDKLTYQNVWEGASSGTIGANGKIIKLTEDEKAAFGKLVGDDFALYNRLSVDNDGKHLTNDDIAKGIRTTSRLHGSNASPNGYWKDPIGSTTGEYAKDTLGKFFAKQFGDDWTLTNLRTVKQMADNGRFFDDKTHAWIKVDPEVSKAAAWLHRNSGVVENGGANSLGWISRSEFDAWNKV